MSKKKVVFAYHCVCIGGSDLHISLQGWMFLLSGTVFPIMFVHIQFIATQCTCCLHLQIPSMLPCSCTFVVSSCTNISLQLVLIDLRDGNEFRNQLLLQTSASCLCWQAQLFVLGFFPELFVSFKLDHFVWLCMELIQKVISFKEIMMQTSDHCGYSGVVQYFHKT